MTSARDSSFRNTLLDCTLQRSFFWNCSTAFFFNFIFNNIQHIWHLPETASFGTLLRTKKEDSCRKQFLVEDWWRSTTSVRKKGSLEHCSAQKKKRKKKTHQPDSLILNNTQLGKQSCIKVFHYYTLQCSFPPTPLTPLLSNELQQHQKHGQIGETVKKTKKTKAM